MTPHPDYGLPLAGDDQMLRKDLFERAYPGDVEWAWPGGWAQAHLPSHRGKQVTITRPTLRDLLDELWALLPPGGG